LQHPHKEVTNITNATIFSFFENASIWGVILALAFGCFWLAMLAPVGWRRPILWLIFLTGVVIFIPSIALVQLPLQRATSFFLVDLVGIEAYERDIILLSIPAVLLSGVVQEAAKLIPILVYWLIRKRGLLPRFSLSIGALAGAGYGVFEAYWLLSEVFAAGFTLSWISTYGLVALSGFWERFFTVAFHTASGAVMGWGVGRGKWWLFYLLTVLWHFIINYTVVLFQTGILSNFQVEFLIALLADAMFFLAFWLRWRMLKFPEMEKPYPPVIQPMPVAEAPTETNGTIQAETTSPTGIVGPQAEEPDHSGQEKLGRTPEERTSPPEGNESHNTGSEIK